MCYKSNFLLTGKKKVPSKKYGLVRSNLENMLKTATATYDYREEEEESQPK